VLLEEALILADIGAEIVGALGEKQLDLGRG